MVFCNSWKLLRRACFAIDLRFPPADEAAFKGSLEEDVLRFGIYAAIICAVCYAYFWTFGSGLSSPGFTKVTGSTLIVFLVSTLANVINLTLCIFAWARLKRRYFSSWNWELIVHAVIWVNVLVEVSFNAWYGPLLLGEEPEDAWGFDNRGDYMDIPLVLGVIVTIVCLFIPIRACVLWILPSFAVLSYCTLNLLVRSPFPESGNGSFALLSALSLTAFLGACRNEQKARREWIASRKVVQQEKELINRHEAVHQVLARFCDCVVHLGPPPAFCIRGSSSRLASLLLYADGRTLEGKSISDFIASEDEISTMVKALQEETENSRGVDLNLHLRDANGREFAVTACFSPFHELGDELQFLVGIAEPQERVVFNTSHTSDKGDLKKGNSCRDVRRETSLSSVSSSSLAASCFQVALNTPSCCDSQNHLFADDAAVVWVDAWTPGLSMVQCNSRFAALGGLSSAGHPLDNWVRRRGGERLANLIDDAINGLVFGYGADSIQVLDIGIVSIKPPGMPLIEYVSNCSAHCEYIEDYESDGFVDSVKLAFAFTNIRMRSTKPNRKVRTRAVPAEPCDPLKPLRVSVSL